MWLIQKNANSNKYYSFNKGRVVNVNVFVCVNSIPKPGKIKCRLEKNDSWKRFR